MDGEAILFVGAGTSLLARNRNGETLPDSASLVDLLLEQPLGTGSKHLLDRVAGYAVRTKGVDFVWQILQNRLAVEDVDSRLVTLFSLPWRRIYTTNYDNTVEFARRKAGRPVSSLSLTDESAKAGPSSIVHLNGYIGQISPANLEKGLLLTDYAYATTKFVGSDWFKFFLRDVRSARSIIFCGYSLSDLDVQRALISEQTLFRKTFFFVSPRADAVEIDSLGEYGTLIRGGIDTLVSELTKVSSDYEAVRFPTGFLALAEVALQERTDDTRTNAQKLTDQLVYGRLPEYEVLHSEKVFGDQPYLVLRSQDRAAIQALQAGPWRDVLYTGEIASGKTASALSISCYLIGEGYRIFYASKGARLIDELRVIASKDEKIAVVFENYASMMEEIRDYLSRRQRLQRVILTERAVVHELVSYFIENTPNLGPIYQVSLDRIGESDVAHFESLVNFGGFWGERSGASEAARQRFIMHQLQASLYKLLLEIIKSEKVQSEIRKLMTPIMADRRAMKLFVSSFIINVLGFSFSINDWQTVFDGQWVRQVMRIYNEQVRHFLNLQGDAIFPRAGILSAHILKTFADEDVILESLVELYGRAARSAEADPEFLSLRIALTRYGSIEPIFPDASKGANIFRYYEEIRVFGGTRNNPDYWLQVGIAATIHDDLARAEKAFDNAYAREKARNSPNLKKIDNYYSRFQMRKAVEEDDPTKAFNTFVVANERLKKQIFLDENRHYPFKTGRYYSDIAAKHFGNWNAKQQADFLKETRNIRERALEWKRSQHEVSPDVEILIRETSTLLRRLAGEVKP